MHAITLQQFGGPEVLTLATVPQPIPGPEQLLVHVKACALNRADLLQRRGKHPPPPGEPDILGLELAGQVVAMGTKVKGFGIGEKVFGLVGGGAYAEYCLIDCGLAMPIPDNLSYVEAAGIAEAFLTAQEAIFSLGELQPQQSILIHAGASGVGTAAIQLARHVKATIYTTVSSAEKAARINILGADFIINYKQQDFAAEILQGIDVIIDFVGAEYLATHLQILNRLGRLILVGLMRGAKTEINLELLRAKMLQIKGLAMRAKPLAEKRQLTAQFKKRWLPLFANGQLRPLIDCTFPLQEASAAHQYMENNLNVGKIILTLE